ncbi:uncharacterized protein BDZ99DRAFT_268567 [Mytilinidion resinicola]|uniref:Uncharacterized protein n=1 Tax=Mytilinidion resinicola TaxID=574789 RepID=A0A6A6YVF2_9PEZI|nr:uncharacterized protein BDZ99DRAFT_268567 [Mytilinidion resinicola]KAF2812528.1 hypothetical protein BDZ99DRAFT_268567 [Mytilinidion resinicola]
MAVSAAADESAPRSSHVSDPALRPFLQLSFSPADYLNATLPPLAHSSASSRASKTAAVSLPDLSSQTQTLLSQLNAHTARLSTILTQLTDDILRSGGRLAYEVEVLRGETVTLSEALTDGLQPEICRFLPGGILLEKEAAPEASEEETSVDDAEQDAGGDAKAPNATKSGADLPPYISQLRTLTQVRDRLDNVIKVFGDAMQWSIPPSEVSLASSFISVSAPEPGSDSHSREEKGREFAEKLRNEISDLITGSDSDAEAALSRIQALRDLAEVWKGTAEEKARIKFVESLVKLSEERQKATSSTASQRQRVPRGPSPQKQQAREKGHGGGFLENISRMRGNIYLE